MKPLKVLIKPLITEKTMIDAQKGVYTFIVDKKANKNLIKKAVEENFNVKVKSIRTAIMKGKTRLVGRKRLKIKTSDFKKAFVELRQGEKIDLFETGK